MNRQFSMIGIVGLLASCSWLEPPRYEPNTQSVATTVKTLPRVELPSAPMEKPDLLDLIEQLEQIDNDQLQYEITNRLAQLRLELMQAQLAEGEADFTAPMATLRQLKALAKDEQSKALVDYQLARVLALSGEQAPALAALSQSITRTGSTPLALESRFRRAEIYFSNARFALAELDFTEVAATQGKYQLHATYLLSWVRFKVGDSVGALNASVSALSLLAQSENLKLDELKQDLLRVTVLALDNEQGPKTLATLMQEHSKPAWQTEVYRALGDWYLGKSRFADSAQTWQMFLTENPIHPAAPGIALEVINTQRAAGFVAEIPGLEKTFITRYGKQSDFYQRHGDSVFTGYEASLRDMLDRYTQRLHASAQQTEEQADYLLAAEAYDLWLTNFNHLIEAQEKRFLYAEIIETALGFEQALTQYELVVARDPSSTFGREAAYALVLGLDTHATTFGIDALIQANLRFAQLYPEDLRSANCQLNAAKHLFDQGQFSHANIAAEQAVSMSVDSEHQLIARRLLAHSAFELAQFAQAELAYRELVRLGDDSVNRLLASVFRQGELAETDGELETAIHHYQRLSEVDPAATLTRDAMYDIAALYEQLNQSDRAIAQLTLYRQQFPQQAQTMTAEISRRLIDLKQRSGDLTGAASELIALSTRTVGEASGVARYRAAELYLQDGQLDQAIEHFRYYAHNFTSPVAVRMEAMHHMDALYQKTGEQDKRHYWLRKKRDLFKTLAPPDRTDRARYLAANAIYELSEQDFEDFQNTRLTLPLARTLKKKRALLTRSLKNYQAAADVGVYEYVTLSYWRMAQHYDVLAADLMTAEAPAGLNALEQSQYQILLEEQAYPFEEKAISLHQKNLSLGWQQGWNEAINNSLLALQRLSPAQFKRQVQEVNYVHAGQ